MELTRREFMGFLGALGISPELPALTPIRVVLPRVRVLEDGVLETVDVGRIRFYSHTGDLLAEMSVGSGIAVGEVTKTGVADYVHLETNVGTIELPVGEAGISMTNYNLQQGCTLHPTEPPAVRRLAV